MSEEIKETPTGELEQGDFKIKKKIKKLVKEEPITKIDFKTPKENLVDKQTIKVDLSEAKKEDKDEDTPIIQEIKEEEVKEEVKEVTKEYKEAVRDEQVVGKQLPENIEKLVSFMEETGGNIDDYVRLNIDYTKVDDKSLLREYYKNTKPHLDHEEISFIMEDYEQGKSDGIKNIVNKSKNIDTASRPQNNEDLFINGFKVKAISGVDSSKLKIKTKNKN